MFGTILVIVTPIAMFGVILFLAFTITPKEGTK